MLTILPYDILYLIIYNLKNIYDVINLSSINKELYLYFDDTTYLYWGRNLYTKEFWHKAKQRSPSTYKPYINMKIELLRIEYFQSKLIKNGMEVWDREDCYKYWESLEKYIIHKRNVLIYSNTSNSDYINENNINTNHTNEEIFSILTII